MDIPSGLYIDDAIRAQKPGFAWQLIAEEAGGPRRPPRFTLGPIPAHFGDWFYGDRLAPSCGIYTLDDISLASDRVIVKDGATIFIERTGMHEGSVRENVHSPEPDRELHFDQDVVLLCGPAYQIYGHWLVDFLPRLLLLREAGHALETLHYLLPHNLLDFSWNWLEFLGIPRENVSTYDVVRDRCHIKRAIIPTCIRGNSRATPILGQMFQKLRGDTESNAAQTPKRKIFVSRALWGNTTRQLINQEDVENFVKELGFDVIYPERLSLAEQIETFSTASIIMGEYGSGLHNSVLAPAGAEIITLRGTMGHPGFLQSGLCDASDQECSYIFGNQDENSGAFTIRHEDLDLFRYFLSYLEK
ncbi:capsular polysaccharide biosynthesis protein-like protein [Neokomagataea thailandica NBRC 106555]|uniref:Glycosyltransferase family 61 protein n=2 Tax=Neokomagataea TaxID=1223423 RepID=A0A4Y6V3Z6_9PROT|nr:MULTISPECIES: glycosyltransferase 61 family protein [Neokomagataea]QDH24842.1 glycosyltransferase family 61 protein [Neokomagataea tanensis]GBR50122.1 capsular polysaccharide biosynthesis protein-like protein [Neokomagataea thailandica NBRC 106555]